jgi:hypothetical protein
MGRVVEEVAIAGIIRHHTDVVKPTLSRLVDDHQSARCAEQQRGSG